MEKAIDHPEKPIYFGDSTAIGKVSDSIASEQISPPPPLDPIAALTELSPIGIAVFDLDLRYVYANPALARLNGIPLPEHFGRKIYDVIPWLWPALGPVFEWMKRTKQPFLQQELFTDGHASFAQSPSHLASYYPILSETSELTGFACMVAPCRKYVEPSQLTQTTCVRERRPTDPVDELGRFFCHELKEPLRNLRSILSMLGADQNTPRGIDRQQLLSYCERSVNRLVGFVQELSIYTGMGADKSAYTFEDTNVVVREAIEGFSACTDRALPGFRVDSLPRLWCCRFELVRVFENLICNAAKASRGKRIDIHISATQDEWMHTFSVRDNGYGISPELLPSLFHPLNETTRRTVGVGESWGLGLAICRKIVERHGGRIWADSSTEDGTRVYFTLPKMSPGKSEQHPDQSWFFVPTPDLSYTKSSESS